MFTGIVERTAAVTSVAERSGNRRLVLDIGEVNGRPAWDDVAIGESIAVSGTCLTVVEQPSPTGIAFDVVPESLAKTTLGSLRPGSHVNLERSLAAGDRFGGHYVTGHIDGVGEVSAREPEGGQITFAITVPPELVRQILPKGSIAVDGISLTVIDVDPARSGFTFAAIPHTLECTTLGGTAVGTKVNLETDAFGKWVLHAADGAARGEGGDERLRGLLEAGGWSKPPAD